MSDASARARANKRKGARWAAELRDYFRSIGITCEILHLAGAEDEGDIVLHFPDLDLAIIIEAKNTRALSASEFLEEARREGLHYEAHRVHDPNAPTHVTPAFAWKRRQRNVAEGLIGMEVQELAALLLHVQQLRATTR